MQPVSPVMSYVKRDIEDKPEVHNDDNEREDFMWKWHLLDIEQYLLL